MQMHQQVVPRSLVSRSIDAGQTVCQRCSGCSSVEHETGLAEDVAQPWTLSLFDCVQFGLNHYRHQLGLHTVYAPTGNCRETAILLPPGLGRQEQLQFYRDLDAYVLSIHHAYWDLVFAERRCMHMSKQVALAERLVEAERHRLSAKTTTRLSLVEREIALNGYRLELAQVAGEGVEPFGRERARRNLLALCGIRACCDDFVLSDIPQSSSPICCECASQQFLRCNSDLMLRKFEFLEAIQSYATRTSTSPPLSNSLFLVASEQERQAADTFVHVIEQIRAIEGALLLVREQIQLYEEVASSSRNVLNSGNIEMDQHLRASLELKKAEGEQLQLQVSLQKLSDTYKSQRGILMTENGIRFPDLWVFASEQCEAFYQSPCSCSVNN